MPQQTMSTVENNFTGGLKTEYTGLNFPENACTDTDNCVFSLIGEVSTRPGINFEEHHNFHDVDKTSMAVTTYKWNNAGGDGNSKLLVKQVGRYLYFYNAYTATTVLGLSQTLLVATVDLETYFVTGQPDYKDTECQFTDGNGYLFVFHPKLQPFYCTHAAGSITATLIPIKIRDFTGIPDPLLVQTRPLASQFTVQHEYNLFNQGWTNMPSWTALSSSTVSGGTGAKTFTVQAGLPITNGTPVNASGIPTGVGVSSIALAGTVTSYSGTTLVLNITSFVGTGSSSDWTIVPINAGLLNTWFGSQGNYPSNADVWWRFKNNSGVFDPTTTQANVTLGSGPARSGFYILDAFNQQRAVVSALGGLTPVVTLKRPRTGAWFQGRVWYSGIDDTQNPSGDQKNYSWSETIYFSQVVETTDQFGLCYQVNDPTSEEFFDLLPTDGGTIRIQGAGSIHKLFPIQNGLLVFAANGIWFITGSQGIGFSANDYTITKISSIKTLSAYSFINVLGYPFFWNEEGIYTVTPAQQGGGLVVDNLCHGTILSFYSEIPNLSKKYARGDYDPVSFLVTWIYRDTVETGIGDRYNFNRMLNFNTANKAFYPYTVSSTVNGPFIHDVKYIDNSEDNINAAPSVMKYLCSSSNHLFTFAEEWDTINWVDFFSYDSIGVPYDSYFVTGFKLHGQAATKFQPVYLQVFSNSIAPTAYKIQGIWDYANSPNSGRYSNIQLVTNGLSRYGVIYRRHKIRGRGIALQFKVMAADGLPFDIIGWSSIETKNTSM